MLNKQYQAAKAFIVKDGKVLILRFSINNVDVYDFPGGKMETGETIDETLDREVYEETGLTVDPAEEIGTYSFFRLKDGAEVVCTLFSCIVEKGDLDITHNPSIHEKLEVRDFLWVPIKEFSVDKYCFGNCSQNLLNLIKKASNY